MPPPDTDTDPPIDTGPCLSPPDTGPCLSVQACLCTCENGVQTGGWLIPALGLLAVARRRRSDVVESFAHTLPEDVVERLRED